MPAVNVSNMNNNLQNAKGTRLGHYGYITQPRTNVATRQGEIVVASNLPYKRRFS